MNKVSIYSIKKYIIIFWVLLWFIFFLSYKPGLFSGDSFCQLNEVQSGRINDWHPAIMQMLWIILYPAFGVLSILLFHSILYFSSFLLLSLWFVEKFKRIPISIFLLGLFPTSIYVLMWIWKDVGNSVGALFLLAYFIYLDDRKPNIYEVLLVTLVGYYVVNVRHGNAFVFFPLISIYLIKFYKFKPRFIPQLKPILLSLLLGLVVAICFSLVQGGINKVSHVSPNMASHPYYFDMVGTLSNVGEKNAIQEFPSELMTVASPKNKESLELIYQSNPYSADNFANWNVTSRELIKMNVGSSAIFPLIKIIKNHPIAYLKHRLYFSIELLKSNSWIWPTNSSSDVNINDAKLLQNNQSYIKVQTTPTVVSNFINKWTHLVKFLYTPYLYLIYSIIVLFYFIYKRECYLQIYISIVTILFFILMCLFSPITGETRYFYSIYLLNNVSVWLFYLQIKYKWSAVNFHKNKSV
jgi:hypothetical protein